MEYEVHEAKVTREVRLRQDGEGWVHGESFRLRHNFLAESVMVVRYSRTADGLAARMVGLWPEQHPTPSALFRTPYGVCYTEDKATAYSVCMPSTEYIW